MADRARSRADECRSAPLATSPRAFVTQTSAKRGGGVGGVRNTRGSRGETADGVSPVMSGGMTVKPAGGDGGAERGAEGQVVVAAFPADRLLAELEIVAVGVADGAAAR